MTVGELKKLLEGLNDNLPVVTEEYNSGYGGLFEAGAEVLRPPHDQTVELYGYDSEESKNMPVLAIGKTFG